MFVLLGDYASSFMSLAASDWKAKFCVLLGPLRPTLPIFIVLKAVALGLLFFAFFVLIEAAFLAYIDESLSRLYLSTDFLS